MLIQEELNEIQGLMVYLKNLSLVKPDDITLIDSNGEPCAVIGYDGGVGGYVLKKLF